MLEFLIPAAGNIIGGLMSQSSQRESDDRAYQFQDKWNQKRHELDLAGLDLSRQSFAWQKAYVQNRVSDAKAAGIHPLFALGTPGASASFSAGGSYGGPPRGAGATGGLGRGLAAASEAAGRTLSHLRKGPYMALQTDLIKAQIGSYNASATRDLAEAQFASSRAARAAQSVNSSGDDRLWPIGEKSAAPLTRTVIPPGDRPWRNDPRVSAVNTIRIETPEGAIRVLDPEKFDELAMIDYAWTRGNQLKDIHWKFWKRRVKKSTARKLERVRQYFKRQRR